MIRLFYLSMLTLLLGSSLLQASTLKVFISYDGISTESAEKVAAEGQVIIQNQTNELHRIVLKNQDETLNYYSIASDQKININYQNAHQSLWIEFLSPPRSTEYLIQK